MAIRRWIVLFGAGVWLAGWASGQEQTPAGPRALETGSVEVGFGGGIAAGNVGGTQVTLPGFLSYRARGKRGISGKLHAAVGVSPRFQFVMEASALSGGRRTEVLTGGFEVETDTLALVYAAGVHARLPMHRLMVPYVAAGIANVQSRTDLLVRFRNPAAGPGQVLEAATRARQKEGAFAPVLGLGVQRFLSRKRLGFRVEAKSFFPLGTSRTPFVQITGGILTWLQ